MYFPEKQHAVSTGWPEFRVFQPLSSRGSDDLRTERRLRRSGCHFRDAALHAMTGYPELDSIGGWQDV